MIYLFLRDLTLATRSGGGFGLALVFFLLIVVLIPFGVGPDQAILALIAPGVLWIGALLACLLSVDRIFGLDFEDGSLDLLATSPIPLEGVVVIKAVAHWICTGLPLAIAAPILGQLLNLPQAATWVLTFSLLVGTPALSMIGAFGNALTLGVKRGGLLLSLLILPLYVPTLIFGAEATRRATQGLDTTQPLLLLAGVTLASIALFPFASAAALRITLR